MKKLLLLFISLIASVLVAETLLHNNAGTTTTSTYSLSGMKQVRTGSIAVSLTDTNKAITFSAVMPDTNYELFFQPQANLSVSLWPSSKTVNGCTLNLSVGVSATISYAAIGN